MYLTSISSGYRCGFRAVRISLVSLTPLMKLNFSTIENFNFESRCYNNLNFYIKILKVRLSLNRIAFFYVINLILVKQKNIDKFERPLRLSY